MWDSQSPPQAEGRTMGYLFSPALFLFLWSQELSQVPPFLYNVHKDLIYLDFKLPPSQTHFILSWGPMRSDKSWATITSSCRGNQSTPDALVQTLSSPILLTQLHCEPASCLYHVLGPAQR